MLLVRGWTYGSYGTCLSSSGFVEYHEFICRQPARYLMYLGAVTGHSCRLEPLRYRPVSCQHRPPEKSANTLLGCDLEHWLKIWASFIRAGSGRAAGGLFNALGTQLDNHRGVLP